MKKKQTKRVLQITLILASIASLFFVPWVLVWAWILPLPNTVQEQVNEALDHGFEGIIVYVDEADKAPAFYTAGWHDRENKIPAKPQALFKLASISKLYNAVAVTKLAAAGRLSLDKTLADYLPELVGGIENADKITLRMMVQHRSGIPNYTDTPDYWAAPKESSKENLELVLGKPANFKPDKDYEYSNTNYLLLAKIMDKVLGYPRFQFIQEEILNRLQLTHTFASIDDVNIDDVMSGYHVGHPFDLKTDKQGMLASAQDVGIFLRALNDGSLFDEGEQDIYSSIYEYEHKGWVPGYQSIAKYHKDIDAVVIQFTNTTDPKLYNWNLADIIHARIVKILKRNPVSTSYDYGTQSDSARYFFNKGWEEIMDNGRWTKSEEAFRKAVEFDPDWILGKSLVGRITRNLEERQELLKELELVKNQADEDERLLLDVNLLSLEAANNRDQGIKNSAESGEFRRALAETNFGKFSRKYPNDNYFKAEYIETLHANHGARLALDSLRALATSAQMKLGFYISYSATLALELGNIEEAISLEKVLNQTLTDASYTSPLMLKAQIYMAQDSLQKAKEYVSKVVEMDPNHIIAMGTLSQINRELENND